MMQTDEVSRKLFQKELIFVPAYGVATAILYGIFFNGPPSWAMVALSFSSAIALLAITIRFLSYGHPITLFSATLRAVFVILMVIVGFAAVYRLAGVVDIQAHHVSYSPADCLYFSIVTFTTLGFGDFVPSANIRLVAAAEAAVGYLMFALFIGAVAQTWGARKNRVDG